MKTNHFLTFFFFFISFFSSTLFAQPSEGNLKKIDTWNHTAYNSRIQSIKKENFEQAVKFCSQNEIVNAKCAYANIKLGIIYSNIGDFDKARSLYKKGIELGERSDKGLQWEILGNIELASNSLYIGNLDEAYQQLSKLYKNQRINGFQKFMILANFGEQNILRGNTKFGEKLLLEAHALLDQIDPKQQSSYTHLSINKNLGFHYSQEGNFALANEYFQNALTFISNSENRYGGKLHIAYGQSYHQAQGNVKQALEQFQLALKVIIPDFKYDSFLDNPSEDLLYGENTIMEALDAKSEVLYDLFLKNPDRIDYLESAVEAHQLIVLVEQKLRKEFQYENSKLLFQEQSRTRRDKGLEIANTLYEELDFGTKKLQTLQAILDLSEYSRAVVLKEGLNDIEIQNSSLLPPNIVEQLKNINTELYFKLQEQSVTGSTPILSAKIESIRLKEKEILEYIKTTYPIYYSLKYEDSKISISKVQQEISADRAIIEYFIGEENSYAIVITKNDADIIPLELDELSYQDMDIFIRLIRGKGKLTAISQKAHTLYGKLFESIHYRFPDLPHRITIIPDGLLSRLPFDALLTEEVVDFDDPDAFNYLLNRHNFSLAFSIATLLDPPKKDRSAANKTLLSFAPGDYSKMHKSANHLDLPNLKELIALSEDAADLFGGTALVYEEAIKATLKEMVSEYQIVMLNTHARAEEGDLPWIAFYDKLLYLPELYSLDLNAKHFIINACESSLGELKVGEGPMSLARGIAFAGCPSVLSTLWQVPVNENTKLFDLYIQQLNKGVDKDIALYEAKKEYLANNKHHPHLWAGLVQIGDVSPVKQKSFLHYLFGGVLVLFLFYQLFSRWRNRPSTGNFRVYGQNISTENSVGQPSIY